MRPEIGRKHFDDNLPLEIDLVREKNARHSSAAELAIDAVAIAQNSLKLRQEVGSQSNPRKGVSEYATRGRAQP